MKQSQSNLRKAAKTLTLVQVHVFMHLFFFGSVFFFFLLNSSICSEGCPYDNSIWTWWLVTFILVAIYYVSFYYLFQGNAVSETLPRRVFYLDIIFHTLLITQLLWLSNDPDSHFFLLYTLPLLLVADRTQDNKTYFLSIFTFVEICFIGIVVRLSQIYTENTLLLYTILEKVIPKALFFMLIFTLAYLGRRIIQRQQNDLAQQKQEIEAISNTALHIAKHTSLEKRLQGIMKAAAQLLKVSGSKVYLKIPHQNYCELVAIQGSENNQLKPKKGDIYPIDQGLIGKVFHTKEVVFTNNYSKWEGHAPELINSFKTIMEAPCKLGDEVIAVIGVFDTKREFTDEDKPLIERFAQHATVAIRDMQLVKEVSRQVRVQKILQRAGTEYAKLEDSQPHKDIARYAWSLVNIYQETNPIMAHFYLLRNSNNHAFIQAFKAYPEKYQKSLEKCASEQKANIVKKVLEKGKPIYIGDLQHKNNQDSTHFCVAPNTKAQLVIPVKTKRGIFGCLGIEFAQNYDKLPEDLDRALEILVSQFTLSLNNFNLFKKIERTNQDLVEANSHLENLFEYFDRYNSLAVVAMVHGEDIHYARNKLGAAGTYMDNIVKGKYHGNMQTIKAKAQRARDNLSTYLETLEKLKQDHVPALDFQLINLNEMLQEVVALTERRKSKNIIVKTNYQLPNDLRVNAPAYQLRQVFLVIVHNALKAMGNAGEETLTILTQLDDQESTAKVTITDTGKGIPEEVQSKLFDLKVKNKSVQQKGVGIGLPWAKFFITTISGNIEYQTSSAGTAMDVIIPLQAKSIMDSSKYIQSSKVIPLPAKQKYITTTS